MSDKTQKPIAIVLAVGQGSLLHALTEATCKLAVPFAGGRRIVDWTKDNLACWSPAHVLDATQSRPEMLADPLHNSRANRL